MRISSFNRNLLRHFLISIGVAAIACFIIYFGLRAYIIREADRSIENLLLYQKGTHRYVQMVMLPALYQYKAEHEIPDEFYAPELFSSSFIVRNQHVYYNEELRAHGFPDYYYKLAATNPRNPLNLADDRESRLIERFNKDRNLKNYREVIVEDGKRYLYVAMPFLQNEARCMVCHGLRENAPIQLQEKYPGQGGFNEKVGEIRAITSIKTPLDDSFQPLVVVAPSLGVGIFALVFLTFFNKQLRNKVRGSTRSLELEVEEKHNLASQLQERESYLNSIQNSMQVGIMLINRDTYTIEDVNQYTLEKLGLPKDKVVGKPCFEFVCGSQEGVCPLRDLKNQSEKEDRILITGKGERIHILKVVTPVELHHQPYYLETFIDITDQKRAAEENKKLEEQLNQSQKMEAIGTLAGGIAHDFNNILSVILGYAGMAKDSVIPQSPLARDLDQILTAGTRARDLVHQILTFSRQTASEVKPMNPAPIVQEVLKLMQSSLPSTIEIVKNIDKNCGIIKADPTRIHQVLMNLCTNAFHAMENERGTLTVSLSRTDGSHPKLVTEPENENTFFVCLTVSDTGCGIAPEVLKKIFDPFFTTKEKGKGTGLGLATTYGIIKGFGGNIQVESEVGRGTTFWVFLPVCEMAEVYDDVVNAEVPMGQERILFVDDDEILSKMGERLLTKLGYEVTAETRGEKALERLKKAPDSFDLIITDQVMPGMSGLQLASSAKEVRPDIPIILCSGYCQDFDENSKRSQGIEAFAMKPLTRQRIALLVRQILDEKKNWKM